jgi:hypothetical protein
VTAREVLDGIKARLSAAVDMGTWSAKHPPSGDSWIAIEKPNGFTNVTAIVAKGIDKADAEFIAAAPTDVARLTAAVEGVLALADRLKSEAENAEHGARCAAEINDGAGLRAWESEKYAFQQTERLIRSAIENALEGDA